MLKKFKIVVLIMVLVLVVVGCAPTVEIETGEDKSDYLEVHFIDVGQGDAILVKSPKGERILIDAGKNSGDDELVHYLKNQGIQSFTAVVGTHPHEDHIGGLDKIIDEFDVQSVYMPQVLHTTKTFEDVLDAIDTKGLTIKTAKSGVSIPMDGVDIMFLAPISEEYEELNDYSAVMRLQYGENVFLFTGDAEELVEEEILSVYDPELLKAEVFKVGHHGSRSSSSEAFLTDVAPIYAVISSGKDNSYGHPHDEVMERLEAFGVNILRTDIVGNIIIKSDGKNLEILKGGY